SPASLGSTTSDEKTTPRITPGDCGQMEPASSDIETSFSEYAAKLFPPADASDVAPYAYGESGAEAKKVPSVAIHRAWTPLAASIAKTNAFPSHAIADGQPASGATAPI